MNEPTGVRRRRERQMPMRALRVFLLSLIVCVAICTVYSTLTLGAFIISSDVHPGQTATSEAAERLGGIMRSLPTFVFYSASMAAPLGIGLGVSGAILVTVLGNGPLRGAERGWWMKAGIVAGALAGLGAALFMAGLGGPTRAALFFGSGCFLTGVTCGAALGWLGWREYGLHAHAGPGNKRR